MRNLIYKTVLVFNDGVEAPITIAAKNINRIPDLVERNKVLYNRDGREVTRFYISDTLITLSMPEDQYEQEVMFCDIVDDEDFGIPTIQPTTYSLN